MAHFLDQLINPFPALLLWGWASCLLGQVYGMYREGPYTFRVVPFFWLLVGIVLLVAWVRVMFFS
jgi:hypothetical protein